MVSEADKIVAKSHAAAESRKEREGDRREKRTTKKNSGGRRAQLQRALEFFSVAFANGHQENIAVRENLRLEPRRKMTCSMGSRGISASGVSRNAFGNGRKSNHS